MSCFSSMCSWVSCKHSLTSPRKLVNPSTTGRSFSPWLLAQVSQQLASLWRRELYVVATMCGIVHAFLAKKMEGLEFLCDALCHWLREHQWRNGTAGPEEGEEHPSSVLPAPSVPPTSGILEKAIGLTLGRCGSSCSSIPTPSQQDRLG